MYQIKRTRIGTSDEPGDICTNGLALFPEIGTARAGFCVGQRSVPLISIKKSSWLAHVALTAAVKTKVGVCGPGYGILFVLKGEVN